VSTPQGSVAPHKVVKRLYTIAEAAIFLGRSDWSVRRLIWNGQLPTVRVGKRVHIDVEDMNQFIAKNKLMAA
jgi:excisionase family DNA binding protein